MSISYRTITLNGAVWAQDALSVPPTPVDGITYRNPSITEGDIHSAWPYREIVESANHNEVVLRITGILADLEKQGLLPWCSTVTYNTGARVLGSDGYEYASKVDTNTGNDPISSPVQWETFDKFQPIDATTLGTYPPGHSANNIPISDGTICINLNSQKLGGYLPGNASGNIPISNGTLCINLNASALSGYTPGNASGNIPISNGTVNTNLNSQYLQGKIPGNAVGNIPINNSSLSLGLNSQYVNGFDSDHIFNTSNTTFYRAGNVGYIRFLNGMIIQFGIQGPFYSESAQWAAFPLTFPNACLNISTTLVTPYYGFVFDQWSQGVNPTTSGAYVQAAVTGGGTYTWPVNIHWIAIGY